MVDVPSPILTQHHSRYNMTNMRHIPPSIDNLVFDMGGILIPITMERCFHAFRALGFKDIANYVNAYYKDGLFQELELGNISADVFCDNVLKHCQPGTTHQDILQAWNAFIEPIPERKLATILQLRNHYRIFLLSNTNIIHWQFELETAFCRNGRSIHDLFENTYLSFERHSTKPDPQMFEELIDETHVDPAKTLFMDDAQLNCDAAEKCGMQSFFDPTANQWETLFAQTDEN